MVILLRPSATSSSLFLQTRSQCHGAFQRHSLADIRPSLPNHLQLGVMAALPKVMPVEVADYHVSRQRCSRAAKRDRKRKRTADGEVSTTGETGKVEQSIVQPPSILEHLVLGLNETTKALERSIADLRFRMAILGDNLAASSSSPRYLPTEPREVTAPPENPVVFILVPHTSVSPFTLIADLATTVATHNTLSRQHSQLRTATNAPQFKHLAHLASGVPEIRLVPLGSREKELAAAAGLRRLTSFAVRANHPNIAVLEGLLPTNILQPPRHSVTLPWPSMNLTVHNGEEPKANGAKKAAAPGKTALPVPPIEYAALHIKGVHTTAPADATARKAQRLIEVRAKRVEDKSQRVAARKKMEKSVRDGQKPSPAPGKWRAARLAKRAEKEMKKTSPIPISA